MKISSIELSETGYYSKLILDYISEDINVKGFYNEQLSFQNIEEIITERDKFPLIERKILAEELANQYKNYNVSEATNKHLKLLKQGNTYTITTGHQVNLMTGPLYFIYKIASCIKLCKQLKDKYPNFNFIPIYWMNSEDHDIDEINNFTIFNKKITWETEWGGASGKMPTRSLVNNVFPELEEILGTSEKAEDILSVLKTCYLKEENLAQATFKFVNHLFGKYGLVILNQDNGKFKYLVKHLIKKELSSNENEQAINKVSGELIKRGYHAQAKPRALNLFYFNNEKRERIERLKNGNFLLVDSKKEIVNSEMFELLNLSPEKFSFNVITRTLYQQFLLPNLAYIGGGGELAYWLQYKKMFEQNNLFFPALILRNTVLFIPKSFDKKIKKLNLSFTDLFKEEDKLKQNFTKMNSDSNLELQTEKQEIKVVLNKVKQKAVKVDATLEKMLDAELSKLFSNFEKIEAKMLRAEKKKFEQSLSQIEALKKGLFPKNNLQERKVNFIEIWFKYGIEFIDDLIEKFNPNQGKFDIILEE